MIAKYRATGNYLEEQVPPELDPAVHDANAHPDLYDEYKAVRASLRRIPCHPSCVGKWSDGQELTEGVEYEVKKHCLQADNCLLSSACITCDDTAFPLPVKSEDDLLANWKTKVEESRIAFAYLVPGSRLTLNDWHKIYDDAAFNFLEELKQKYLLAKKQPTHG